MGLESWNERRKFKKLLNASSLGSPESKKMRKLGRKVIKDLEKKKKGS